VAWVIPALAALDPETENFHKCRKQLLAHGCWLPIHVHPREFVAHFF
jgi:hypothetical protein